ncbi:MAG: hypothetical protein KKD48_05670, partial [Nanoarchaeota archaeon]|nr:hypothetical protein [Nanoarchaeota archaeon]
MKRNFGDTKIFEKEYKELEKRLKEKPTQKQNPVQANSPVVNPITQINADDFIILDINSLHGNQVLISPYELQDYNNLNYNSTHEKLLNNGLYMPTPNIFMNFFTKVTNTYNNKTKLFNAKGNQLSTQEVTDMYKHLTTNHIDIYNSKKPGAWTW